MGKRTEFTLSINGRNYKLKSYGKDIVLPITDTEKEYRDCSLFISDSKERLVSNRQPINNIEVAFNKGETNAQVIARLALNFDEDLPVMNDVREDLTKLIQVDLKLTIPETQSSGILPLV